jgi:hypothetical protein
MSALIDAETLLAVDVGTVNTRASIFDVVDGRYRLVATAKAPSTAAAPLFDIGEGVRMALDRVQTITGRRLVDESDLLIMPVTPSGSGVDIFVATASAGPQVRAVLVGLMPGVSAESAKHLAASTYIDVVGEIGLMDKRRDSEKIDVILSANPDLILVTGGTDGGATESVLQLIDLVGVAADQIPPSDRPRIVYAGNRSLSASVVERFGDRFHVDLSPNVRPSLGIEDLSQARLHISDAISEVRATRVSGFEELDRWSGGNLLLSADAFGRVIKYLSRIYEPEKGVLGVDVGANQTTIAAAFEGDLRLTVNTDLGLGAPLPFLLEGGGLSRILRWMPTEISPTKVQDYVFNKSLNPSVIPAEIEDLHIEFALTRELIRTALRRARTGWPRGKNLKSTWLLPAIEPIIISGEVLARAPRPGYAALTLLDALEPTGISTLVLDPHSLTPALGATAGPLPMVTVHLLESGSFVSLGTIVSPVGRARTGRKILRVQLERDQVGEDIVGDIRMGQLVTLPLKQGENARLTLRPERGIDVGFGGPGKAGALRVAGGALGLIIDARGRPLNLQKDPERRRESNEKWLWDIGALV